MPKTNVTLAHEKRTVSSSEALIFREQLTRCGCFQGGNIHEMYILHPNKKNHDSKSLEVNHHIKNGGSFWMMIFPPTKIMVVRKPTYKKWWPRTSREIPRPKVPRILQKVGKDRPQRVCGGNFAAGNPGRFLRSPGERLPGTQKGQ